MDIGFNFFHNVIVFYAVFDAEIWNKRNWQPPRIIYGEWSWVWYQQQSFILHAYHQDGGSVQAKGQMHLWTFSTRDQESILVLRRTLVLSHVDYCTQLCSPCGTGLIADLEVVQRYYIRKIASMEQLNSWESHGSTTWSEDGSGVPGCMCGIYQKG